MVRMAPEAEFVIYNVVINFGVFLVFIYIQVFGELPV